MTESPNNIVGLIGLGLLGNAIAEQLLASGFEVVAFDIDYDKTLAARELGAWSADSPAHVAQAAERIVLSLPDSNVVSQVVEQIIPAGESTRCIIDTTTGDPQDTIALAAKLKAHNTDFIDATVSGSSKQLRQRTAILMVGGDDKAIESSTDILNAVSDRIFRLGPSGSGAKAKLASNLVLGLNRAALAEGLVFAEQLGLDLDTFLELLKASPAKSAAMDSKGPKMIAGDFAPQSRIRQHRKDLSLILKHAAKADQPLPLTQTHREILDKAIEAGDGDLDNAAVIRQIRREGCT